MKATTLAIILTFTCIPAFLQSNLSGHLAEENLKNLQGLGSNMIHTFNNAYQGIKGTPYLYEKCTRGIIINNDSILYSNELMNYDCYNDAILVKKSVEGDYYVVKKSEINSFLLKKEDNDNYIEFRKKQFVKYNKEYTGFVQVLYDGGVKLYVYRKKDIKKADYQGGYSAKRPYDEFIEGHYYFIEISDTALQPVKRNKKSVISAFPVYNEELKLFAKNKKLNFKDENDVIKICEYYDSLIEGF